MQGSQVLKWGKRNYDKKLRSTVLDPGDRVLVRNLTPRGGTGKLRNHWKEAIDTVVRRVKEDLPIYEVQPEQGKGKIRILHRNLLLPCDHLPMNVPVHSWDKAKKTKNAQRDSSDWNSEFRRFRWGWWRRGREVLNTIQHVDCKCTRDYSYDLSNRVKSNKTKVKILIGKN